jgi:hypothetical protein
MHSVQHHRSRAAQARRLAGGILDRELEKRLKALAVEHDAIADRLEQLPDDPPATN